MSETKQAGGGRVDSPPDPELVEKARRRKFSAPYKLAIVREADVCSKPGEIGALLRREGLYTSHLSTWRKQRDEGALDALSKRRGRRGRDPRDVEIARLRRRAERAEAELEKARKVMEVQGNVSALLGELLGPRGAGGREQRALMEQAVEELTPILGTRPACRALDVAPSTIYRRRRPPEPRPRSQSAHPSGLCQARAAGRAAQRSLELGQHEAFWDPRSGPTTTST